MNSNKMEDDRYAIKYRVVSLDYNFGTSSDEPHIVMMLTDFRFGDGNKSSIIGNSGNGVPIWLYLNKSTFSNLTGRSWNGTPEDVKQLNKDLEGKIYSFNLNMRDK